MTVQRYTIQLTNNPLCPFSDCSVFCFPEIIDYLCTRYEKQFNYSYLWPYRAGTALQPLHHTRCRMAQTTQVDQLQPVINKKTR